MLTEDLLLVRYTTTILLWKGSQVQRTFSVELHIIDTTIFDHLMFITTAGMSNSVLQLQQA